MYPRGLLSSRLAPDDNGQPTSQGSYDRCPAIKAALTASPAAAHASWMSPDSSIHDGSLSPLTNDTPPVRAQYASYAAAPRAWAENIGPSSIMGSMRINHVRAAARTIAHGLLVAVVVVGVAAPEVIRALGIEGTGGLVGCLLAVSVVIARVMAVPAVDAWLRRLGISVAQIHEQIGTGQDAGSGPAGGSGGGGEPPAAGPGAGSG